jgi:quercetin dioxygenase-like cupin family protein
LNLTKIDLLAVFSSDKYSKIPIIGAKGLLRLLCFEPGQCVPLHKHLNGDEYFYVIKGKGKIIIGNEEEETESGCIIKAPAGVPHKWTSGSRRLILLSVIIPSKAYDFSNEATKMEFTDLP